MNKNFKILFIANQEYDCAPNQRFRFEQYFSFFEANNFNCILSHLLTCNQVKVFYKKGYFFKKVVIVINSYLKRKNDLININNYDFVFIAREALMTGSIFFEKKLYKKKIPFIFDFDDAIWYENVSPANRIFKWIKNPNKTSKIIEKASLVIAGNDFLASYARKYNSNVQVIPTTVDTSRFSLNKNTENKKKITIGWSGSNTTLEHFKMAIPILIKIKEKFKDFIEISIISDRYFRHPDLEINSLIWSSEKEVELMSLFDIGIMPLPDNEWSRGKCGLKGLTYMALEIPTIMSPVGVNTKIINQGVNGFLATTEQEWIDCLSKLIESESLRKQIGKEGRKTVLEKYSVDANKQKYLDAFNYLVNSKLK